MADIEFDREAVGITAKRNWRDADYFAEIGSGMYYIRDIGMVALPFGEECDEDLSSLQKSLESFLDVAKIVALEYSDACAILGSGLEETISNMDETEAQGQDAFRAILERMERED